MKTPHESQVERAKVPGPPVKDSFLRMSHKPTSFRPSRPVKPPASAQDGLARDFSVARFRSPSPPPRKRWDRIRRLLSAGEGPRLEDYFRKPPSNWTSHSRGIQLYG